MNKYYLIDFEDRRIFQSDDKTALMEQANFLTDYLLLSKSEFLSYLKIKNLIAELNRQVQNKFYKFDFNRKIYFLVISEKHVTETYSFESLAEFAEFIFKSFEKLAEL